MPDTPWDRRELLKAISAGAAAGFLAGGARDAAAQQVKWSEGTEPSKLKAPPNACDCHHHIYDGPADPKAVLPPGGALVAGHRALHTRLGTRRNAVAPPSAHRVRPPGPPPRARGCESSAVRPGSGIDRQSKTWVKLSGAYADTKVGPPTYADSTAIAQAYAKAAPERCVWGSDWPHPGEREKKPDDAVLFDLLLAWAPDEAVRHRILVDNPAALYDFPKSA